MRIPYKVADKWFREDSDGVPRRQSIGDLYAYYRSQFPMRCEK